MDPATVAPEGSELGDQTLVQLVHSAASVLLPGGPDVIDVSNIDRVDGLLSLARAHGVLGPLMLAIPDSAESLSDEVCAAYEPVLLWCMELELRLLEIKEWFDAAGGIECRVLKGPAVAHLDELDPSLRSFADLDILIRSDDLDHAVAVLAARGIDRVNPQPRPGFDRRFGKGVGMRCPDGIEIDLHRTLCGGALRLRIPQDDLFSSPESFEVGGQRFQAMKLEHRALHAAYHSVMGTSVPPLKTLRDLGHYVTDPRLTPDTLVQEAHAWGGETVLAEAVRAMFETLTLSSPEWQEWLSTFVPDPQDLDLIQRSRTRARWPLERPVLEALGWRDRVALILAVAVPSREVLEFHHQTRWQRYRAQSRMIVRGR